MADLANRFSSSPRGGGTLGNVSFMITAWSADALLIWRYAAIYSDIKLAKWCVLSISIALQFAAVATLVMGQAVLLAVGTTLGSGYVPAAIYEIIGQLQVLAPISLIYRVMQGRACEPRTMAQITAPFHGDSASTIAV
ncbi:hypothetical protein BDQ17DRAFT_1374554 [Cyathus striatus]|nr:hypothetical protein BDQ17DRAFT_1374554 [Cyathus striatus]